MSPLWWWNKQVFPCFWRGHRILDDGVLSSPIFGVFQDISSFLCQVRNSVVAKAVVLSTVPQGGAVGPLLFVLLMVQRMKEVHGPAPGARVRELSYSVGWRELSNNGMLSSPASARQ